MLQSCRMLVYLSAVAGDLAALDILLVSEVGKLWTGAIVVLGVVDSRVGGPGQGGVVACAC